MIKSAVRYSLALLSLITTFAGATDRFTELYYQAQSAMMARQYDKAIDFANQALVISDADTGTVSDLQIKNLMILGWSYRNLKQWSQSETYYEKADSLFEELLPQNDTLLVFNLTSLGEVYLLDNQPMKAEQIALRAVVLIEKRTGVQSQEIIGPLSVLGSAYLMQTKIDMATQVIERALRILDTIKYPSGTYIQNVYRSTAKLYRITGRESEAAEFDKRANSVQTVITSVSNVRPPPAQLDHKAGFANDCKFNYPRASFSRNEQGKVTVEVLVGLDGKLISSQLISSSGYSGLDQAVIDGLSACQYKAAQKDGKPVKDTFKFVYNWIIPD